MKLFQETWRRSPFWMLVGCVLMNRTRWEQARGVLSAIRRDFPTVLALAKADPVEIEGYVRHLGLQRSRSRSLVALARAWRSTGENAFGVSKGLTLTSDDVRRLPGCGKYAADSWAIFVEGRRPKDVRDVKLKEYLRRKRCSR